MEVSVIVPMYNARATIDRALQSILQQKGCHSIEIIVVDDGSTDSGIEIVKNIVGTDIKIIHQKNHGVAYARNQGILIASYGMIAFLDADDEWKDNHLEVLENLINKFPDCLAWSSGYELRNPNGVILHNKIKNFISEQEGILTNYFKIATLSAPPVWTSATIVRKDTLQLLGGFTIGVTSGEDLLLWARIATCGKIAVSRQITSTYNVYSDDWNQSVRRCLDYPDKVSVILKSLACETGYGSWRWRYLSHWHRMRGVIALNSGSRKIACIEGLKVLRYYILNPYGFIIIALCCLPTWLCIHIFKLKNKNRKRLYQYENSTCT